MGLCEQIEHLKNVPSDVAERAREQGRLYNKMKDQGLIKEEGYHLVIHPAQSITPHCLIR